MKTTTFLLVVLATAWQPFMASLGADASSLELVRLYHKATEDRKCVNCAVPPPKGLMSKKAFCCTRKESKFLKAAKEAEARKKKAREEKARAEQEAKDREEKARVKAKAKGDANAKDLARRDLDPEEIAEQNAKDETAIQLIGTRIEEDVEDLKKEEEERRGRLDVKEANLRSLESRLRLSEDILKKDQISLDKKKRRHERMKELRKKLQAEIIADRIKNNKQEASDIKHTQAQIHDEEKPPKKIDVAPEDNETKGKPRQKWSA